MIGKSKATDPLIEEMMSLADEYQQKKREQLIFNSEIDRSDKDTMVLSAIEEETISTEDAFGNRTHVKKSIYHQWELAQDLIMREIINPEREKYDEGRSIFNPSNPDVINKAHQETLETLESIMAMKEEEPEEPKDEPAEPIQELYEDADVQPAIERPQEEDLSEGFSIVVEEEEYNPEPTRIQEQAPDEFCHQVNYEFQFGNDVMPELCYIKNAADERDAREYFERICNQKNINIKAITNVSKLNVHNILPNVTVYTAEPKEEKQEEAPKKTSFFKSLAARRNKPAAAEPSIQPEEPKEDAPEEIPVQASEITEQAEAAPSNEQDERPKEAAEQTEENLQSNKPQRKYPSPALKNFFGGRNDVKEENNAELEIPIPQDLEPEEKSEEAPADSCRNDTEYIDGVKIASTQILGDTSGIEVRSIEKPVVYCLTNLNTEVPTIIDKSPFYIGCKQEVCDLIILQDPKVHTVSRKHAEIRIVDGKVLIKDTSANGTFIGKPGMPDVEFTRLIKDTEQMLKPGQIVRFADRSYLFDIVKEEE